jgi:peptide/nickel transport system ATP-binding protein
MEALILHSKMSTSEAKARTLALFNEVQLPDPAYMFARYPHQLSGGQKQRVMIAMAMSCDPTVLIADEPTTALDVTVQKAILDLMQKLQMSYNMGILFITHDLGVIAELADTVIVMYKGKIVEQGRVLDIFTRPHHPYTRSLLACRPPLNIRVRRLPVVSDFMKRDEHGEIIEVNKTVSDALKGAIITEGERAAEKRDLYAGQKILEIQNLSTWFPSKRTLFGKRPDYTRAVDEVSLDVFEGETLGLVG